MSLFPQDHTLGHTDSRCPCNCRRHGRRHSPVLNRALSRQKTWREAARPVADHGPPSPGAASGIAPSVPDFLRAFRRSASSWDLKRSFRECGRRRASTWLSARTFDSGYLHRPCVVRIPAPLLRRVRSICSAAPFRNSPTDLARQRLACCICATARLRAVLSKKSPARKRGERGSSSVCRSAARSKPTTAKWLRAAIIGDSAWDLLRTSSASASSIRVPCSRATQWRPVGFFGSAITHQAGWGTRIAVPRVCNRTLRQVFGQQNARSLSD